MQPNERPNSKRLKSVPSHSGKELMVDLPAGPPELTAGLARSLLRILQNAEHCATTGDVEVSGSSHTDAVAS